MRLGETVIKIVGILMVIVGAALLFSLVGLTIFGITLAPWWAALIAGILFLGAGIYIIRGGTVSL